MANRDSGIFPAEDAQESPCGFKEHVSTMEPNCLAETLSAYFESCEPPLVTEPDPCNNLGEFNISKTDILVDPFDSIILTETSELRDNDGKGSTTIHDVFVKDNDGIKQSSTRRSTRKNTSKKKTDTKVATRKCSRSYRKKPMVDLLAADVGRRRRSDLVQRARPSTWGSGGNFDDIFKQAAETKSLDSMNQTSQNPQGESRAKGLLLKFKLGNKVIQNCQFNTIPNIDKELGSDIKENLDNETVGLSKLSVCDVILADSERKKSVAGKELGNMIELGELVENRCLDPGTSPDSEVINVIPETQTSGITAQGLDVSSKDIIVRQSCDCGVGSGIPSPEILDDAQLLYDKSEICEKQVEGSWSSNESCREGCTVEPMASLPETIESDMKLHSNVERSLIPTKSISGVLDSVNKKRTNCQQNGSHENLTTKGKIKEESGNDLADCDAKSDPVTGNHDGNGLDEGSRSTVGALSNSTMVASEGGSPQSAWVCCDDCHKWRRISAILADSIESTECRWICKDNMDKTFADCSIPQEKSNADINEELELSDASCEEDTSLNSIKLGQKHPIDPSQSSWKLIKTNMFLHRNRKNQTIDEIMVCHCKPLYDGRMGCRDECLNRMLNIECVKGTCPCGEFCSNQQFQKRKYAKLKCFPCGKKGYGLQLQEDIPKGRFLIEYVGEVLDMPAYEARQRDYASKGHKHFYFMTLNGSEVIDACAKGNLGRFINHSCEPNCRTEKWMVNGEVCIGLFAVRDIRKGEELTFDYNYVRVFGAAAKKCVCGSARCRGVIGGDSQSGETLVLDDSDEEECYENNNNKLGTKNNGFIAPCNVEKDPSSDSLLVTDDKNDDPVESTEREVSYERSSSSTVESKEEILMPLDTTTSFKVKDGKKETQILDTKGCLLIGGSKKKHKSHTNESKCKILKTKVGSKAVKRAKSVKLPEVDSKPPVLPNKIKKLVEDNLTGRFEAVQEALNTLLKSDGGISKRRDASKGYLKLLCLTAHGGNGEGIQSNRDLSMIMDALLKTKSRSVLLDIINKNGLQMLHNLLKRYRKEFNKIPILRKLLKVLEYLAETKILTLENILKPSPNGAESFKESILSLTEHTDKQVHQIARTFRDRWIPWSARKVNRAERDVDRMEPQASPNTKSIPVQHTHNQSSNEVGEKTIAIDHRNVQGSGDETRTRKRKSRWDEAGDINSPSNKEFRLDEKQDEDGEAPPGFSSRLFTCKSAVIGQPQERFNPRIPTSFGIPSSVVQQVGEAAAVDTWIVAPAMTFHPFPPLPPYPRSPNFQRFRSSNTLDRRYFKQQKWNNNYSRSWDPNNKYGQPKVPGVGYGRNEGGYNGNGNHFYQQQQ